MGDGSSVTASVRPLCCAMRGCRGNSEEGKECGEKHVEDSEVKGSI